MFEELLLKITQALDEVRASNTAVIEALRNRTVEEGPFDVDGAAAYLKLHPQSVRKLAKKNKLTYCRIGDGERQPLRFLKSDLDEFLERSRIEAVD